MKGVTVIGHPLVQHHLTRLRDETTQPGEFRRAVAEATTLLVYEATRSLAVRHLPVKTPLATSRGCCLAREVLLVPVLRAGLGMLDPLLRLVPNAHVGFIGLKRDEATFQPVTYYQSLPPDLAQFEVILLDPMLATGGSSVAALDLLAQRRARRLRLVNLIAAPEGIRHVHRHYPGLPIFTAAIDQKLNHQAYIVPGLGDAGDRLFGV